MVTTIREVTLTPGRVGADVGRVVLFAALLAGLSYLTFPYPLSPGIHIDLQVVGVFLAALMLGPVRGSAAAGLFLLAGAAGLPVFDAGGGLTNLLASPTIGYYLAYPVAAAVSGFLIHRGTTRRDLEAVRLRVLVGAMLAGLAVIYIAFSLGYVVVMEVGVGTAVIIAAVPLFPPELVKVLIVLGIVRWDLLAGT